MCNTMQGIIYTDISDHFTIIHIDYSCQAAKLDTEIKQAFVMQCQK